EFLLNEEKVDCEAYVQAMQNEQEPTKTEERLEPQARLDVETRALMLEQRYKACVALRAASVHMVNAEAKGDKVNEGDPETERVDKWKTRLNIAMIDKVGIDPNSIPKPKSGILKREDVTTE